MCLYLSIANQECVKVVIDGKIVCNGTFASGGYVTAPVRLIAEALGAKVGWDGFSSARVRIDALAPTFHFQEIPVLHTPLGKILNE